MGAGGAAPGAAPPPRGAPAPRRRRAGGRRGRAAGRVGGAPGLGPPPRRRRRRRRSPPEAEPASAPVTRVTVVGADPLSDGEAWLARAPGGARRAARGGAGRGPA